jgi:DNA-binding XRE family transcriptional regulator
LRNDTKLHKLKYWRSVLHLRQEDVATLIGCKKSYYCSKENGKADISLREMLIIQAAFNKKRAKEGQAPLKIEEIFLP